MTRARGFTLLEVLVVITIVAVLTGTVLLGFTGADQEQALRGAAHRMAMRVELARQHALSRNREWGIYIERNEYSFAEFDPETAQWVLRDDRPFDHNDLPDRVELTLETDGVGELPFTSGENDLPQIVVFSSGEITPFTIYLEPDWDTVPWLVTSDGISRAAATREGEEA